MFQQPEWLVVEMSVSNNSLFRSTLTQIFLGSNYLLCDIINVNVIFYLLTDVTSPAKIAKFWEGKPKSESTEDKEKRETKRKSMYRKMTYGVLTKRLVTC